MSHGEVQKKLSPRIGVQWGKRPPDVDCGRCWPSQGWGHRPTRKGKKKWDDNDMVGIHDVKGVCFYCAGTGLVPIPLTEVFDHPDWGLEEGIKWMRSK